MTTELTLPAGTALSSNPKQFKDLADDYDKRRQAATISAAELRGLGTTYGIQHAGPDIEVIAAGIGQLADVYDDRVSGFLGLADAFETTHTILLRLEERSEALETKRSNLRSAEMYGEVTDADITAASEAVDEFDAIQKAERSALRALADAVNKVTIGEDANYDAAAWNEIIERAIANADNPGLKEELQASWVVIADHAEDGTIEKDGIPEETSEKVTEARINGQTSGEAGLPASFFPSGYDENVRRLRELERDDHTNIPWLGNPSDEDKTEAAEIRKKLGLGDDPDVTKIQIISDTAEQHNNDEWKGQQLGEVYKENSVRSDTSETRKLIAGEISEDPESSVGFFNELGPKWTGNIPSTTGDGTTTLFGDALAVASHQKGKPTLSFTGDQVIELRPPSKGTAPAEILFAEGNFEAEFLADATEASIELRETRIKYSKLDDVYGDPSNILIGRAAEKPRAVQLIVEGLEEKNLTHLLVDPPAAYVADPNGDEPITEFLSVGGGDKVTASILLKEATEHAEFSDPGVAAGFDQIMGQHATVIYDEDFLKEHGINPSGIEESDLDSIVASTFSGEDQRTISQADWEAMGLTQWDWKKLQEKTHKHGQGLALVAGNEELIRKAIAHDVKVDGTVDNNYAQFGLVAGVLERNYIEAAVDYEAQLDANSEERNRWISTGRSTSLFIASFVPAGRPVASASFGVADILAGHFDAEGEVGPTEDTNREKLELAEQLNTAIANPAAERFAEIARVEAIQAAEARGELVVDYDGNEVRIVDGVDGAEYEVRIDGKWQTQEPNFDPNEKRFFGSVGKAGDEAGDRVGVPYTEGATGADPSPNAEEEAEKKRIEDRRKLEEADLWLPTLTDVPDEPPPPPIITAPGIKDVIDPPPLDA